jgi:succinate dehydrogenase/fumarate reductase cytochrome b subunit
MQAAEQLLNKFVDYIINPLILVIFAAGFFMFVWGLVQFIIDLGEGAHREEGIEHMKWGIVGMLVMVSVYGIIALLSNTFGLGVDIDQRTGRAQIQDPDISGLNIRTDYFR